ncbi:MAG TPA: DNA-3-methyladenine glycosylase [Blastocatellia bacterium]|nr:DNA-3-methyladenine glycosylase [Blastocatellia bacterium]
MAGRKKNQTGPNADGYRFDPSEAVAHLSAADERLALLMRLVGPFNMQIRSMHNPFEALARNIVYQQLHGTAASAIHARVLALFDRKDRLRPRDILAASEEELRGAGLSRAKTAALKDLAEKTVSGVVPSLARLEKMSDEEIIERLSAVRGIGRWTVEMLLIFRLGRPDVLPVGDFAVRKGFGLAYLLGRPPAPKELALYGERWKPFRTVASWYLWRASELPPEVFEEVRGEK